MLFLENRVNHNVFIISDDLITCNKKKNKIFFPLLTHSLKVFKQIVITVYSLEEFLHFKVKDATFTKINL